MTIQELEKIFEANKNLAQAQKMKKYLRNQFEFLGIAKPRRALLEKDFIKSHKNDELKAIMLLVKELHQKSYREYMYTAQILLLTVYKRLTIKEIYEVTSLTVINAWWENTDGYNAIIKRWLKLNPQYIEQYVKTYYQEDNLWLRRIAIICQLSLKDTTDFPILTLAIQENINDQEFFIQKAIGWALRDYSKFNLNVVQQFMQENETKLSKLAIKEGSKYLKI
ncbi:MAG: DNA alkylation repair protein [Mycoplasmatales bacterium]